MAVAAASITKTQLEQCLKTYSQAISQAYDSRIKDPRKREEAKARDQWRYVTLPKEVHGGKGMTLPQLERLVQWKITHGQSRPFLPAMIRKNEAAAVTKATAAAAKSLSSLGPTTPVQKALDLSLEALDAAAKLTGVGPATAALILSIYDPVNVPFFQDELFAWCVPEKEGTKLKYDKKEYSELFKRVYEVRKRLGKGTRMVDLEQASFVLRHIDLVDELDRKSLETGTSSTTESPDLQAPPEAKEEGDVAEEPQAKPKNARGRPKKRKSTKAESPEQKPKRTKR